ncbi:MAG TPA: NifU family protein [Candidatus Sulfotelmatobacter sp.]|jgi:NifU-like protein|nr:NifU family protein [Candidatus Sulfotelmatobacter sp.]
MTDENRRKIIEDTLAELRPAVQQDGGDIDLVEVRDDVVRVRLTGACTHCAMAGQTLGGLRRVLNQRLDAPVRVLPAA